MERRGQLSIRWKTKAARSARMRTIRTAAKAQPTRCGLASAPGRFVGKSISPKKYRPPHPKGMKGGCSPQNNLQIRLRDKRIGSGLQENFRLQVEKKFGLLLTLGNAFRGPGVISIGGSAAAEHCLGEIRRAISRSCSAIYSSGISAALSRAGLNSPLVSISS